MIHGFDVSAYQGNTVPAADLVIVKATEGSSYTSSRFAAQWASAKTRAKVRGAYHFARPEQSSGSSQADRLINAAKAVPGEVLVLDLEASKLNQAQTNVWAREFGDRLRERAPGVTTVIYMGSGYASNGTGKDLNQHFDWWWYPQYPSTAATSKWPVGFSPWLPPGLTCGWKTPHIWQWTDNFGGLDANVSTLTIDQLAAGGHTPTPQEDDVAAVASLSASNGQPVPAGGDMSVTWTRRNTDRHGFVNLGKDGKAYSMYPDGPYWVNAVAWVRISGLTPGDPVDVAWTRMTSDGKGGWKVRDTPWRVTFRADATGLVEAQLPAQFSVDKSTPIRLRVYNPNATALSVLGAVAEATFLKY